MIILSILFNNVRTIVWNGKIWVCGLNASTSSENSIAYSYDGITWSGTGFITSVVYSIAWNGNLFIGGGLTGVSGCFYK